MTGALNVTNIEFEILRNHLDKVAGGFVLIHIGVLVFQIIKLVVCCYLDNSRIAALAGFFKHKAVKDGGAVHGKTARVPLLKAEAIGLDHLKGHLARLPLAFPLNGDILHHGREHCVGSVLYQQFITHGMVNTCPG